MSASTHRIFRIFAALVAAAFVVLPGYALAQACYVPPLAGFEFDPAGAPTVHPVAAHADIPDDANCLACHGDAGKLIGMVKSPEAPPEDGCATAPSRPPFLNYFVNETFLADMDHAKQSCVSCHGGDLAATDMTAHEGMVDANETCAECHEKEVANFDTSLHASLSGQDHALILRSGAENFAALEHMNQNDCATCHTTCSDCHLTLPLAVGGGLIKGHEFMKRAPMEDSCALCHGSRAGGEYLGHNEGIVADVHFTDEGMHCLDCHKNDLHGDGTVYENRWQVAGRAQCTDCHDALPKSTIEMHTVEHTDVACQVCHAQPYQNCFDCHTGIEDGAYFRRAGHKELMLKFGRNTAEDYPFNYVTLRNNPVARNSFDYLGEGLLPNFDDHPTWKTAAPHNIVLRPSQTGSCWNCHLNDDLFLEPPDLDPDGAAANTNATLSPRRIE